MLTSEQATDMIMGIEDIYTNIENDLLISISKRFSVNDAITPDTITEWQVEKLKQLGALRQENVKIIAKNAGKTVAEIEKILNSAGYTAVLGDEEIYKQAFSQGLLKTAPVPASASPALKAALKGAFDNTREYFNLINTTALESAKTEFVGIINQVYLETSLGITDYNTAMRKAVRNLADKGIAGASYRSAKGKETFNHLDVAVRRCILTSTSQTAGIMQETRAKEWGSNLVEVSSHVGARPAHAAWQGRVYSLEGSTSKYPNLRSVTHYGEVDGLCGANCKHVFYPFFEGISNQTYFPYDKEENAKTYKESQIQRQHERSIREQKRRILTAENAGDTIGKRKAQLALKENETELKAFLEKTGRTQRSNRQQSDLFGRSEAQKAVWAKRKDELRRDKQLTFSDIKPKT